MGRADHEVCQACARTPNHCFVDARDAGGQSRQTVETVGSKKQEMSDFALSHADV